MPENYVSEESLLEKKVWAVVGATPNREKYGYKLYQKLKSKGYQAYAVNPVYPDIEGNPCYPDLSSLPEVPQVINMVVSPKRGRAILEEAARLGICYVWFQPGSYDQELLDMTKKLGIEYVLGCVLVSA